ncbi:MAG: ABC transporter ATP-binding protein [bacterium]
MQAISEHIKERPTSTAWSILETIRRLSPFLKPYRKHFYYGFLCVVATDIIGVIAPWILKYGIEDLQAGVTASNILIYALLIVLVAGVAGIFRFLMRQIIISVSRRIEYDLRVAFFSHLQCLSPSFYDHQRTGDLMTRASSDIEAVRMVVGPAIMYSMDTILTAVFALSFMFAISVPLTLSLLLVAPALSGFIYLLAKNIHEYSLLSQEKYSELNDMVQEHLSGIRVIRAYCQEEPEKRFFRRLNLSYLSASMKLVWAHALLSPFFFSIFGIGMAVILYIGGRAIITGTMSLGDFVAFSAYIGILAWPVLAVGWVLNLFQRGAASLQRIQNILDIEPQIRDDLSVISVSESVRECQIRVIPASEALRESIIIKDLKVRSDSGPAGMTYSRTDSSGRLRGEIVFNRISFRYPESPNTVLKDIDLVIPAGTSLGIVGQVGSGKTTLVSLLPRLYPILSGELTIDGYPLESLPLEILRRDIAVVPQDSFLFSDRIKNNILFAETEVSEQRLVDLTELVNLSGDVADFPDGFETWVGERGITLSGGQKQRACLARALGADPRILILDDCFSAVDTNTEAQILHRLRMEIADCTVLIIAHRISTLLWADQIIVLEEGRIVERGTHHALLKMRGRYAELYKKQLLEEELKSGV